jgi:hypothetical protein
MKSITQYSLLLSLGGILSPRLIYMRKSSVLNNTRCFRLPRLLVVPPPWLWRRTVVEVPLVAATLEALIAAEGAIMAGFLVEAELDVGLVPCPGHNAKFTCSFVIQPTIVGIDSRKIMFPKPILLLLLLLLLVRTIIGTQT